MKLQYILWSAVLVVFMACSSSSDDSTNNFQPLLTLTPAFEKLTFEKPLDLQSPNDGTNRIFVVEKSGRIKVFKNQSDSAESKVFLDLSQNLSTTSEQGHLGLAFHPNFETNGFFYVHYNPTADMSVISRFNILASDANKADLTSEIKVLEISQPFANHNGGQLAFGADGYLYISMGDGGNAGDPLNHGQNTMSLLGTILRINIDIAANGLNYSIPTDNPFIDDSTSRPEIYAYGFRNPWRFSFDSSTGDLWAGDVGQEGIEEIDIVISGGNYGWNTFEGTQCFSGNCNSNETIFPVFQYTHANGDNSITGGYVYRGSALDILIGKYVYSDFASGRIWAFDKENDTNQLLIESGLGIASFGTDTNNELYICSFDGKIYKFEKN